MTGTHDENGRDAALSELMEVLDPPTHRLAQIEEACLSSVRPDKPRQSLASEWLELMRMRPLVTSGLALASGTALLLLSPATGALAMLLLSSGS